MILENINIEKELVAIQRKIVKESNIIEEVKSIWRSDTVAREGIITRIENNSKASSNHFNFDLLETNKIFHINNIKLICIDYRLRFLDSSLFKDNIPAEAITKIKNLEKVHQTKLDGFKIMAPSKLFKLKNADDPLLFVPIGNDYYYLIHKWGKDISPLRKMLVLPLKSMSNAIITILALSALTTLILPISKFGSTNIPMVKFISFLFVFKSYCAIFLYYSFWKGKNFNAQIWNSKFYN
jgi:hypothetical protein